MRSLLRQTSFVLMIAAGVMMCMMMLHITADVFMKYAFNQPFFGTVEVVSYYYMIGAIYLPLSYVQLRGQHISVELFFDRFPERGKRASDALALLGALLFFGILAYQAGLDFLKSFEIGEIVMGSVTIPIWPSRLFLPISFGLVWLVSLVRLIDEVILGRPQPRSHPPIMD